MTASSEHAMAVAESIDQEFYVQSGEAQLYIKVRGEDVNHPVLLYLHGGPGETFGPLVFQGYAGPALEKHFVVAYLHQRNTCMSPEAPLETLTLSHFITDVANTVKFLKAEFKKEKVFLLGHSFGGILGYAYLAQDSKYVEKFVSVAGPLSIQSTLDLGYEMVMTMVKEHGTREEIKKMEDLGPSPHATFDELMAWRRIGMVIQNKLNTGLMQNFDRAKVIAVTGVDQVNPEWQKKSMAVVNAMYDELNTVNLENKVNDLQVPMLLLAAEHDIMAPVGSLKEGLKQYGGKKEFFVFENSNHFMFVDEPDLFITKVVDFFGN